VSLPVLRIVRGEATPEEIAALVAVLQGVAVARAAETVRRRRPGPEWAAHRRKLRATYRPGPGGWRASSLPG
jgi:hypothetical protein